MRKNKKKSPIIKFLKEIWNRLYKHDIFTYAASLSYYTLLSFVPLIFIAIAAVGEVAGRNRAVTDQAVQWVNKLFPFMMGRMEQSIYDLVKNKGLFGGIGFLTLAWSAHMVLAEGEKVIRLIFGVHQKRWLIFSQIIAWGIFLLSVTFFAASFFFGLYIHHLLPGPLLKALGPFTSGFLIKYIPSVMAALTVTAAYKLLPQRTVPLSLALAGGGSFAILWEVAKKLFFIYAERAHYVSLIYGPLSTLMLFLFFVYYSALLFIIIAEFVACSLDMG